MFRKYNAAGEEMLNEAGFAPQAVVFSARKTANVGVGNAFNGPVSFGAVYDPFITFNGTRFQPKVPGYYRLTTFLAVSGLAANASFEVYIVKNITTSADIVAGKLVASDLLLARADGWVRPGCSDTAYFNGTTDYAEVWYWGPSAAGLIRGDAQQQSTFAAELVAASIGVAPEPWHLIGAAGEPAFLNGWSNPGGGFAGAGFFKDPHGIVHLQGRMTATAFINPFNLPAGYRPGATYQEIGLVYWNGAANTPGRIQLRGDGTVNLYNSANTTPTAGHVYDLNNVHFRAEQ